MVVPVLHICDLLALGGVSRHMENLAQLANRAVFAPVLAGFDIEPGYVDALRRRGITAGRVRPDLAGLADIVPRNQPFIAIVNRGGGRSDRWDEALRNLRAADARVIAEINVFGFADTGPGWETIDFSFANSMHTMWLNWRALGRPDIDTYLRRHGVAYYPVVMSSDVPTAAALGGTMRDELGIPRDAFVFGDVCRPDAQKLDYLSVPVMAKLGAEFADVYFITRSYPEHFARKLQRALGARYLNLPPSTDENVVLGTLDAMNVLLHMSSMGESFGMAVAEAMRCGVPVVANETPGRRQNNAQPELIVHGETGYLASDAWSVVERCRQLHADRVLCHELGKNGRRVFERVPFEPRLAMAHIESRLAELAKAKGWDVAPGLPPAPPLPPLVELRQYLASYTMRATVAPLPRGIAESLWSAWVDAGRLWWRLERKLVRAYRA